MCLTPYALSGALYASGATLSFGPSLMVGAMLAVAVAIKPHYILVVFAVEAAVAAARARRGDRLFVLRTDLTSAVAASAVLIGLTALVHPTYFSVALPLALWYYPSYGEFELTWTTINRASGGTPAAARRSRTCRFAWSPARISTGSIAGSPGPIPSGARRSNWF